MVALLAFGLPSYAGGAFGLSDSGPRPCEFDGDGSRCYTTLIHEVIKRCAVESVGPEPVIGIQDAIWFNSGHMCR